MKRIFNGSGGRKTALILSLCLIFALAVGTTVALLKANTAPVQNTFTAATSGTKIEEKLTDNQKTSIQVRNTGTATSYVRVKLVCNWVDNDGNVSATPVPAPKITNSEGRHLLLHEAGRTNWPDFQLAGGQPHQAAGRCSRWLSPRGDGAGREHSGRAEQGCGRCMEGGQSRLGQLLNTERHHDTIRRATV